jgi:hypothetical protein
LSGLDGECRPDGYSARGRPSAPNLRRPAPAGSPQEAKGGFLSAGIRCRSCVRRTGRWGICDGPRETDDDQEGRLQTACAYPDGQDRRVVCDRPPPRPRRAAGCTGARRQAMSAALHVTNRGSTDLAGTELSNQSARRSAPAATPRRTSPGILATAAQGAFYLRLGFQPTGERSGGQTAGVLDLQDRFDVRPELNP